MPYATEPFKELPKVESGPAPGAAPTQSHLDNRLAELEQRVAHLERLTRISNVPTETRTY